jgi:hypothetical protein
MRNAKILHIGLAIMAVLFSSNAAAQANWRNCGAWRSVTEPLPTRSTYSVSDTARGRVLIFQGDVRPNESRFLATALASAGRIDEVWLHSPGGVATEGMAMARVLRARGLAVHIPARAMCASACTTAFLGGVIRTVSPQGFYGVHMFSRSDSQAVLDEMAREMHPSNPARAREFMENERMNARFATNQAQFVIEMGASMRLAQMMTDQTYSGLHCLSRIELNSTNVVNSD